MVDENKYGSKSLLKQWCFFLATRKLLSTFIMYNIYSAVMKLWGEEIERGQLEVPFLKFVWTVLGFNWNSPESS